MWKPFRRQEPLPQGGNRDFRANTCLDHALLCRSVKARGSVQAVPVRESYGGHFNFSCTLDERFRLRCSIEKAERAGCMQLNVLVEFSHTWPPLPIRAA